MASKKTAEAPILHDVPVMANYPLEILQSVVVEGSNELEELKVLADCLRGRSAQAVIPVYPIGKSKSQDGHSIFWRRSTTRSGNDRWTALFSWSKRFKELRKSKDGALARDDQGRFILEDPVWMVEVSILGKMGQRFTELSKVYRSFNAGRKEGDEAAPVMAFTSPLHTTPRNEGQAGLGLLDRGIVQNEGSTVERYQVVANDMMLIAPTRDRNNGSGGGIDPATDTPAPAAPESDGVVL